MMKRIFAIVIAVLSITSLLTFSENAEGTDNLDGKTKDTAINKNISMDLNETKFLYFNTNVRAFEYVQVGDGYSYTIEQANEIGKVEHTVVSLTGTTINDTWPSSGQYTLTVGGTNVTLMKEGSKDAFSLAITLKTTTPTHFYLKFTVTSYGLTQVAYYQINVTYDPPEIHTFEFRKVNMDYEGNFYVQGGHCCGDQDVDPDDYKYFAIGLYSGISIHNNLTITGIVDDSDTRWITTTEMPITIVATNIHTNEVFVSPATIQFSYDRTFDMDIEFTLKEGGKTLITQASDNKTATVLENTDLTLTVNDGTSAEIVFSDGSDVQKKYLWTPTTGEVSSPIATHGAGKYDVTLRQLDGSEDFFSVNVIATFTPVNKIYVTCAPV